MSEFENFDPIAFQEVDSSAPYDNQVRSHHDGEVVLIGTYAFATTEAQERFLKNFSGHADFMRNKPGFISAQLHRGIAGAKVLIIYATWASPAAFHAAFADEEKLLAEQAAKHDRASDYSSVPTITGQRILVEKLYEAFEPLTG